MRIRLFVSGFLLCLLAAACATGGGPKQDRLDGLASWYGHEYAGRKTANGEIFDPMSYTAAHRTLPFGTMVRVQNQRNGRSVDVRINDRGPFIESRIIDISYAAAIELDMVTVGVAPVRLEVLRMGAGEREAPKPYVVTVPTPAKKTVVDSPPPPVAFPIPEDAEEIVIDGPDITVEIIEGSGEPSKKTAAPDGRTIVMAPPPAAQKPAQRTSEQAAGRFVVQLGAFSIEENAQNLKAHAESLTQPVFIERDGGLYRVRVGPFADRVRAIEVREKLDAAGFQTLLVTLE